MLIYEKEIVVAAIGQAIMQNARARAVIALLQAALGVQVHHVTGSKFMVQQLNKLGFAVSYSEVQLSERSAALNKGTDRLQEFDSITHTLHLHADNADDTIATLDGYGQCQCKSILVKLIIQNSSLGTCCENVFRWMAQNLTNEKSALVQEIAWGRKTARHHLS